jgi:hypothetical protein
MVWRRGTRWESHQLFKILGFVGQIVRNADMWGSVRPGYVCGRKGQRMLCGFCGVDVFLRRRLWCGVGGPDGEGAGRVYWDWCVGIGRRADTWGMVSTRHGRARLHLD